ncbi:hypothetical protein [Streptomyces acidiscabies]|uniref:hypothetical protein n=1 Tax=Streptomyces acidiscabies TaxID=42234 RepID=UPI00131D3BD6|nr:hypothetical protein [Streptomyces acidiscabies]
MVRDELAAAWRDFAAYGDPGWAPYDVGVDDNSRAFGGTSPMVTGEGGRAVGEQALSSW